MECIRRIYKGTEIYIEGGIEIQVLMFASRRMCWLSVQQGCTELPGLSEGGRGDLEEEREREKGGREEVESLETLSWLILFSPGSNSSGPHLLWSLYYNVELHSIDQSQASTLECPRGLYVTSEPDTTIGYEKVASEVCVHVQDFCIVT